MTERWSRDNLKILKTGEPIISPNRWNQEEATPIEDIKAMIEKVKIVIGYMPCSICGRIFDDDKPTNLMIRCPACNLLREKK